MLACVCVGAHELSSCFESWTQRFLVTGGGVKENDKDDDDMRYDDKEEVEKVRLG